MCKSNDAAIINTWERELSKENYSLPREIIKMYNEIGHNILFDFDDIVLDGEVLVGGYTDVYKFLKGVYKKGNIAKIICNYKMKKLQSEVYVNQENACHIWLKGNIELKKNSIDNSIDGTDGKDKSLEGFDGY